MLVVPVTEPAPAHRLGGRPGGATRKVTMTSAENKQDATPDLPRDQQRPAAALPYDSPVRAGARNVRQRARLNRPHRGEAHGHHHRDVSGGWLRPAVFGAMDGLVTN